MLKCEENSLALSNDRFCYIWGHFNAYTVRICEQIQGKFDHCLRGLEWTERASAAFAISRITCLNF